jgi:hypothetical protein
MHDSKAVALAISLPNASGLPATYLVDDIAWTLNRSRSSMIGPEERAIKRDDCACMS